MPVKKNHEFKRTRGKRDIKKDIFHGVARSEGCKDTNLTKNLQNANQFMMPLGRLNKSV